MAKIQIAKHADVKHVFQDGFSCVPILENAYEEVNICKCAVEPGASVKPELLPLKDKIQLFLFFDGKGYITTPRNGWNIREAGVFVPEFDREEFQITAAKDSDKPLEYLHITADLIDYDRACLSEARITLPRWRGISEGWTYWEDFKSEEIKSMMLIEHRNLGRLSMGAVFGKGPDVIGQHIHNELQQWYFPLPGSAFTYTAGGERLEMEGADLSFTPSGNHHGSEAGEGQIFDYIWFELCTDGYPGEIK